MLSISQKKYLSSLKQKKYRSKYSSFVVEGEKMLDELLKSKDFEIESVFGTEDLNSFPKLNKITTKELASVSQLKTPNKFLAVVKQKSSKIDFSKKELILFLDNVQDPGNLGTIIRVADWFGISSIVCSPTCVDVYNSKVVQSTMGSIFRVNVVYTNLVEAIAANKTKSIYGALLGGDNVYNVQIKKEDAILIMGNESKGISAELIPYIDNKITIPQFGEAESLNVAVATSILCSEYRRGI